MLVSSDDFFIVYFDINRRLAWLTGRALVQLKRKNIR